MIISEILKLSFLVISEYYRGNLKPFFDYVDDDVLWIGPAEKQLLRSKEAIVEAWSKEENVLSFTMGSVTEYPIPMGPKCCGAVLTYPVYTHYPDGSTMKHSQRIDYTWVEKRIKNADGETTVTPRIVKLHISNGSHLDSRDFIYAIHSENIDTGQIGNSPGLRVLFRSKGSITRSYLSNNILWIEKLDHGRRVIVHTAEEDIPSSESTEYFAEEYPGVFLSPHKSYLVNPIHVREIHRFGLTLDNGKSLSIPEKKYTKFKAEFAKWVDELNKR